MTPSPSVLADSSPRRTWVDWLVLTLVLGYYTMSRSFAHWGVPPIYLGEVAFAAIFFLKPAAIATPWLLASTAPRPLSPFAWALNLSAVYGLATCLRGVAAGFPAIDSLQNIVFHAYPFFFFAGLWVGLRRGDELSRLAVPFAWLHGVYGVLFIVVISPLGLTDAAEDAEFGHVGLFGHPLGAATALLGLLCFHPWSPRFAAPLAINFFVLAGMQLRAVWLGFAAAVVLWGVLARRLRRLAAAGAVVVALFAAAFVADVKVPGPATRGGEISARNLVGRALAAVDARWAAQFTDHSEAYAGNIPWRLGWWKEIVRMVHESPQHAALGPGYGYPLWTLHPTEIGAEGVRTPHNVWMYALGYGGWIGVALFFVVQFQLASLLWRTYRKTGQPFGICLWTLCLVWSAFDNFFETPYSAIPFYLVAGMATAPLFSPSNAEEPQ